MYSPYFLTEIELAEWDRARLYVEGAMWIADDDDAEDDDPDESDESPDHDD